jgi:hypothetical protein
MPLGYLLGVALDLYESIRSAAVSEAVAQFTTEFI